MADAISIQELIDARTDAKTLEEAVNGDAVTTVLSRLGETYPTLSNALNQINSKLDSADTQIKQGITNLFENGGLPATPFATKALMTASALVDGDFAMVTDDTVADNNGLYVKTAGSWVKSTYDPLVQAKSYTDTNKEDTLLRVQNVFATKALMIESSLVDGSNAQVNNDTTADNNGFYKKTAGAWVKSDYDPLLNANDYTNNLFEGISSYIFTDDAGVALAVTSLDGSVLMHITSDGKMFLAGDETDVADKISGIEHNVNANDGLALVEIKDAKGDHILAIDRQAQIYVGEDHLSLQEQIKGSGGAGLLALKLSTMDKSEGRDLIANSAMSVFHDKSIKTLSVVEPFPEIRRMIQRIPAALPLEGNKLLYMWGGGQGHPYNGDAEGVVMYKRILTYSDDGEILDNGVKEEVRRTQTEAGIAKHPMLGRTQSGRIILIWDEREGRLVQGVVNYTTMMAFSDDGGLSFTPPVEIPRNPLVDAQVVGSTGTILTLSTGRLVCPMYTFMDGHPKSSILMMYSDDNGSSWNYGSKHELPDTPYSLQEPVITCDENDVIYIACRHNDARYRCVYQAISTDMGESVAGVGFNEDLNGFTSPSAYFYDKELGILLNGMPTGQSRPGLYRDKYQLRISADGGQTWKIVYQPFDDDFYFGYSQLVKLDGGLYALCTEGLHNPADVNIRESVGIFIFNLKEVFNNVVNS